MAGTLIKRSSRLQHSWLFKRLAWKRFVLFIGADSLSVAGATLLALLWSEGQVSEPISAKIMGLYVGLAILAKLPAFYSQGLHSMSWRHVGMRELLASFRGVALGSVVFIILILLASPMLGMPPLHILIPADFLVTLFLVGGFRASKRALSELRRDNHLSHGKRILVVGAGNAGEQVVRSMRGDLKETYYPVGYIDDDPTKLGISIHGVKVLGNRHEMARIVDEQRVDELLIAIPSAGGTTIREIVGLARDAGITRIQTLPSIVELFSRTIDLSKLQDLRPEDLLRREQVTIDDHEVQALLRGSVVLITGAGGSIGSELCRQVAGFAPKELILFERDETYLFDIERELSSLFPDLVIRPLLGDICDRVKIEAVFDTHRPEVVFHAAAYKHVPLMEENPADAVYNNVVGTRTVAEASLRHGAERFVLISTDKAVNPSSVMGATKRLAEMVIQELNELNQTKFMAVRFGNVLGSRGSVIPIFKDQIKRGGPVTVTHREMSRYFMTASEAVLLVLQAASIGEGGEVFVLDMGEPVKILDLAMDMIRMAGHEPNVDIPIVFTGMRPGEKLFEDILSAEEGTEATRRNRIYIARILPSLNGGDDLFQEIDYLRAVLDTRDKSTILNGLLHLVPNYSGSDTRAAPVSAD